MPEDKTLDCVDCKRQFVFTIGEQSFYKDRKLTPPKRCPDCRAAKKLERERQEMNDKQY